MLTESPFYQEIFQKGEARGETKGKAEVMAEGLLRVFVRRFNHVDDALIRCEIGDGI